MTVLVIGIGNDWRSDDGAGLELARRLAAAAPPGVRVLARAGDQAMLLDDWREADRAVVVDAASSGAPPGTIHRHDAAAGPLPARLSRSSTHAFGVAEAVELGRALDRLPRSLTVCAIEGESFAAGAGLTPAVEAAVAALADELGEEGDLAHGSGTTTTLES